MGIEKAEKRPTGAEAKGKTQATLISFLGRSTATTAPNEAETRKRQRKDSTDQEVKLNITNKA